MRKTLFPDEPRDFPGRRILKILLRAGHVICAAGLFGAYLLDADAAGPWLAATIFSGSLILLLDLHESAAFMLQVKGLVILGKLGLLATLPLFAGRETWLVGFLIAVSVVSSHAPGKIRHHLVFGRGKVRPSDSSG